MRARLPALQRHGHPAAAARPVNRAGRRGLRRTYRRLEFRPVCGVCGARVAVTVVWGTGRERPALTLAHLPDGRHRPDLGAYPGLELVQ